MGGDIFSGRNVRRSKAKTGLSRRIKNNHAKEGENHKAGHCPKSHQASDPQEPEKAEIAVEGADHLYREIRVENTLENGKGKKVKMKPGCSRRCDRGSRRQGTIPQKKRVVSSAATYRETGTKHASTPRLTDNSLTYSIPRSAMPFGMSFNGAITSQRRVGRQAGDA